MKKTYLFLTIGCALSLLAKTEAARSQPDGYLFAHMVPEDYGGLYYSVSRDGLHWQQLNGGLPINPEYKGHPDIVRGGDGRWHAIGIPRNPGASLRGIHWTSFDLMHWRQEPLPESVFDCSALGRRPDDWLSAPKLFFDEATGDYVITWHALELAAEKSPVEKGERRALWKSMRTVYVVTRDFKTFTKPKLLFAFTGKDAEMAQIDTVIRKHNGVYYAVIKDERWEDECQTGKLIRIARSQGGVLGPYANPGRPICATRHEAPSLVLSPTGKPWVFAEDYDEGKGRYDLFEADSPEGVWHRVEGFASPRARHGCVIRIDARTLERLEWERPPKMDLANVGERKFWFQLHCVTYNLPRMEALMKEWKGREVTLKDVPIVKMPEVHTNGVVSIRVGAPGDEYRLNYTSNYAWLNLTFPKGHSDLAALDVHDRLASVTFRFSGTFAGHDIFADYGIDGEGLAATIAPTIDPLKGADAATITGVELPRLCYELGFGRRQYAELQRRLAGRRLVFDAAGFCGRGKRPMVDGVWPCEIFAHFPDGREKHIEPEGMHVSWLPTFNLDALVRSRDAKVNEQLSYVLSDPGLRVKELSAVVASPESCRGIEGSAPALVLESPIITLNHDPEPMPTFDPKTVTGDELTKWFAQRRDEPIPERLIAPIKEPLVGRELEFKDLLVVRSLQPSVDGKMPILCRTKTTSYHSLPIALTVPMERLDAFPRDPVAGDLLLNVKGTAKRWSHPSEWLYASGSGTAILVLEPVSFDGCHNGSPLSPLESADRLSGDRVLELVDKLPYEQRGQALVSYCRRHRGQRVSFSKVRLPYNRLTRKADGSVDLSFEVGPNFRYTVSALIPPGLQSKCALEVSPGATIGPVSGTWSVAPTRFSDCRNDSAGAELENLTFDFQQNEGSPLPAFDPQTITGEELLQLFAKHPCKLTIRQKLELIRKLEGRRLTFKCRLDCVSVTGGGHCLEVAAWVGAGVDMRFALRNWIPQEQANKVHQITGTLTAEGSEGHVRLGTLHFRDAVVED